MRLLNVRVGCTDLARSRAFYDATFAALGLEIPPPVEGYPVAMYRLPGGANFMVGAPRDGQPASGANGGTILFEADTPEQVATWHAAGLAQGGTCEGEPGPRPQARGATGAYLRDPDGNKLAAYCGLALG